MPDWPQILGLIDFCAVYFTIQLVRCASFSFVLIGIVMFLRKTFFRERTFLRGMLWSLFLLIPFLGRLKLFYENEAVLKATWGLTCRTMTCLWADRIYMMGIFTAAICIFGKRLRLRKSVDRMETTFLDNIRVSVTDMNVTPFTVGLLKPKIVLPKAMVDSYSREELRLIVQHEQTHIRLGHLWFGTMWDILRCLLWVNPFLTIFLKAFRGDMEDICDRVCIQNSKRTAYEYGLVLLKTLKLLCPGQEEMPPAVTYAGERDFAEIKRRMGKIAGFCPYQKWKCMGMTAFVFLLVAAMLLVIHTYSYARYNESKDIMIGNYDGKAEIVSHDTEKLRRMISYDDSYVYVDREAFEDFLEENNAKGEIWIVFGGFYKLPGLGGAAQACIYEKDAKEGMVRIPYESIRGNWYLELIKWL